MNTLKISFGVMLMVAMVLSASADESDLVEGATFRGYGYSEKTGVVPPSQLFKIEDGVIYLAGPNPGYLMSRKVYHNFKLTARFRWTPQLSEPNPEKKKNSGLMYDVPLNQLDAIWPQGIQYQVKQQSTGDFILLQNIALNVNGSIYGPGRSVVVKHFSDEEKADGEWNEIRIVVDGAHIQHYLNGILVNEGTQASVTEGRIMFQYEGCPIEFRDVRIEEPKE